MSILKQIFYIIIFIFFTYHIKGQWEKCPNLPTDDAVVCFANANNYIFIGTDGSGVFLSTNNGDDWILSNKGMFDYFHFYVYSLAANDKNIFAGTGRGVLISTIESINWIPVNWGIEEQCILSLAIKGDSILAGTSSGKVFLSSDYAKSWKEIYTTETPTPISSIVIIGNNVLIGAKYFGVLLSKDGGKNWISANQGLSDHNITSLIIYKNKIFAGTTSGVFLSEDSANSWTTINQGLIKKGVECLITNGSILFAGIWGGGVYFSKFMSENWIEYNIGFSQIFNMSVYSLNLKDSIIFAGTMIEKIGTLYKTSTCKLSNIDEFNKDIYLGIYPNPVIDYLTINRKGKQRANLIITNLYNQIVYQRDIKVDETNIDLLFSYLPAGAYFVRIIYAVGKNEFYNFIKF